MTSKLQEALEVIKKLNDLSSTTTTDQMFRRQKMTLAMLNVFMAENPDVSEADITRALGLPIVDIPPELEPEGD